MFGGLGPREALRPNGCGYTGHVMAPRGKQLHAFTTCRQQPDRSRELRKWLQFGETMDGMLAQRSGAAQ